MRKKNSTVIKIIGAVVVLFLVTSVSAVAIGTNPCKGSKIGNNPVFVVNNADASVIDFTVNTPVFEFGSVYMNGEKFATLELPNEGFTVVQGEARLPALKRMVEIPQGAKVEIAVKSVSWGSTSLKELGLPQRIVPVQPSLIKIPDASQKFVINDKYYATNAFMPSEIAKVVETGEIRGRRFVLIEISPLQYNPVSGELNMMISCEIQIELVGSNMILTNEKISRYTTPAFEDLFETAFINYGYYENDMLNMQREQEGYLIVVYDNFYEEIGPLASLKESMGFDTTVTRTSEIPGGPTKEHIRGYIKDAYDNWTIPPSYVLLVGDTSQVPTYTGTTGPTAVDLYYVTVNGSDYFPDIYIGRFPAADEADVIAMVDKTVYYEQGCFNSTDWIKKAAFMASTDRYWISEGTHNYVIDNYLLPNGYTCDKLYTYTYGATTQDVKNALNNGRSLAVFSGHGSTYSWADGPSFSQNDVQSLTNENMCPFVCSHACLTGSFNVPECFGETWLREPDKAALAFWGASESTLWDEDDILEKGMFKAWWADNLEAIGGMTDMALYYLYENYSGGGYTKYYFEAYNILGDPSVKIWHDNPSAPPETPQKPNGPAEGVIYEEYTFSTSTTDPDGDQVYYLWDWGDGNYSDWLGPYLSGETAEASHSWNELGDYEIKVKARDGHGAQSSWSEPFVFSVIENSPPNEPVIDGPKWGIGELEFTFVATDPNDHDVSYYINWGDGNNTGWLGPYHSGEVVTVSHIWSKRGTYTISARAQDIIGDKSGWSNFKVWIPIGGIAGNSVNTPLVQNLMQRLLVRTTSY